MNQVYKSVWNESIGAWVAVSENSPARGKSSGRVAKAMLASAVALGAASGAIAANADKYVSANDAADGSDGSKAIGLGSIAIGGNAVADSTGGSHAAMAIGSDSRAGTQATALGPGATASAKNSVSLGTLSVADREGTVSVGTAANKRQIVNVAAGTQANDVVNVGQLQPLVSALGGTATLNADGSVTGPTYSLKGTSYNNVGDALSALANSSGMYFHANSTLADSIATGPESVAIGGAASSAQRGDISIGSASSASGAEYDNDGSVSAVAIGSFTTASAASAVALGSGSNAKGAADTALGAGAIADSTRGSSAGGAVAVGASAAAVNRFAVAIGRLATASAENSVALGAHSVADRDNTVSVGTASKTRQIVNVAAGAQANDAVNVSQLQNVTTLLGGGAKLNTDGTIQAPAYSVAGKSSASVGDAIADIDTELDSRLAYDSANKAHITLGGVGTSQLVTISNVNAGNLSSTSTDAVNGSQLVCNEPERCRA